MAGNKKGNIFKRMGKGVKDVFAELKKVIWPTMEKLKSTSAVVLLVIVFFAVFLTLIGSGGRWLLDKVGFYDSVATTASESEAESVPDATTTESTEATTEGTSDTSETSESTAASEA